MELPRTFSQSVIYDNLNNATNNFLTLKQSTMKVLIPMFIVILTVGFITSGILVLLGYSNLLLAITFISAVAIVNYFNLYKHHCPEQYNALKDTLARLGDGASYAIHR